MQDLRRFSLAQCLERPENSQGGCRARVADSVAALYGLSQAFWSSGLSPPRRRFRHQWR